MDNLEPVDLYELKLHEEKRVDDWCVKRVPGGWIYYVFDKEKDAFETSVFVPYAKED